ncbi:Alpha/Beta hydrolase protein [Crucibulum laeve]|uniref:Alpha/Beta hydrolase protein n=1 Tax=Crucibulum laeve TaxID=68775 RepID=A0A5C3M0H1_9AGAR|nr:Alpha/Beta hydrolase protein [Crucibulum laeve]
MRKAALRILALGISVSLAFGDLIPRSVFSEQQYFKIEAPKRSTGDPAGHPNIATRLEITSNGTGNLACGDSSKNKFQSGYAHFTNNAGEEDKHMFWWLFEARNAPEDAPVVMTFGGGPGASGLLFPFSGAGPCMIQQGESGEGKLGPSPYSWTDHVNLLAIDHPVGVGFSYGDALRNSSDRAAWDVDDFLQVFWRRYPHLAKNKFMISSGSYGGTYIPHVLNTIRLRNLLAKKSSYMVYRSNGMIERGGRIGETVALEDVRIIKMPEAAMMLNVWSDTMTHFRWIHESNCNSNEDGNMFFNATWCEHIVAGLPHCLDELQLSYEQPTVDNKWNAMEECYALLDGFDDSERDPYDWRQKCSSGCSSLNFTVVEEILGNLRNLVGVPKHVKEKFEVIAEEAITIPFIMNGDMIQPSYKLLGPVLDDGLRLLVYNGMYDGIAPWRSSIAWMRLLENKHQTAFRVAPEVEYPKIGTYQGVGQGAGDYAFVKVRDAGHMIIKSQPQLTQHLMINWLNNKPFF